MAKLDLQLIQNKQGRFVVYDDTNRGYYPRESGTTPTTIEYRTSDPCGNGTYLTAEECFVHFILTSPTGVIHQFVIEPKEFWVDELPVNPRVVASWINDVPPNGYTLDVTIDEDNVRRYALEFASIAQEEYEIDITSIPSVEEGLWEYKYIVTYYNPEIADFDTYTTEGKEMAFKQTEIYRAKRFEELALQPAEFKTFEHRNFTNFEVDTLGLQVFESYYKAMRAALEAGDDVSANNCLTFLQNYIKLNPLTNDNE